MSITLNGTTGITTPDIDSAAAPDFDGSNFTNLPVSAPLFGTAETVTASKTLTTADDKKVFNCTTGVLFTLPTPAQGLVFGITASTSGNVSLVAASGSTKVGSYAGSALIESGNSAIITCDGTNWAILGGSGKITIRVVQFEESGTYTPNGPVAFLACCTGSSAGLAHGAYRRKRPTGGGGYSEKFFSGSLASSYSVVVGQKGLRGAGYSLGTAGGTTTFDTISIASSPPSPDNDGYELLAGGIGTGGDFNATGGSGGYLGNDTTGGGGGGSASRAGNGGNGGSNDYFYSGSGGGTGGNNAADSSSDFGAGGAAATSEASGVHDLTLLSNPVFDAGDTASHGNSGGAGASSMTTYTDTVSGVEFVIGSANSGKGGRSYRQGLSNTFDGYQGHVTIVEFYA